MKSITLIDLDCLLDTRLGTLSTLNEDAVRDLLLTNKWHTRKSDDIGSYCKDVTTAEFKEAYEDRGKYTLSQSRVTNIVKTLAFENKKMLERMSAGTEPLEDYGLVINSHPYNLTLEEELQIALSIKELMGGDPPIKFIRLLPESTRLTYLDLKGFTDYITYDIAGWIYREFNDCAKPEDFVSFPNITVWGPKLLQSEDSIKEVLKEHSEIDERDSPFDLTRVVFGSCVKLEFLPIEDFCIISA